MRSAGKKYRCFPLATAVAGRSTRLAVITPGEGEREPLARRLAKAFQVPEAEIGRILPPGGSVVVEVRGLEMK